MTESEWLACKDPMPMLEFLRGKASDRKSRLMACAIAMGLLGESGDEDSRRKIEAVERFAGNADLKDFANVTANILSPMTGTFYRSYRDEPHYVVPGTIIVPEMCMGLVDSGEGLYGIDAECLGVVIEVLADSATRIEEDARLFRIIPLDDEVPQQRHEYVSHLLRCIFGNIFRRVTIDPWWLTWNNGLVTELAQGVYDDRAFDRLPVLSDALEEVGCDNADILGHLRSPGPHVRGCWPVDLILGKE